MKKNYTRNWLFKLKSLAVFGALLFAGTASAQLSGTYTIDPGSAASSSNFQSFTQFQDSLEVLGLGGAITVNVSGTSTFSEVFEIDDVTGSSATNTITINGNNAMITSANAVTINIVDQKYVTVNKLRIKNTNLNGKCMVIRGETSHITVDSSEFIRTGSLTSSSSVYLMINEGGTVFTAGADKKTDLTITNNYFHSEGSNFNGAYACIAIGQAQGEGGDQRILIANNELTSFGNSGIYMRDVSGVDIISNEIYNPTNFTTGFRTGIYHFSNFNFVGADEKCVISENYIHDINTATYTGATYGIAWYAYYVASDVDIKNNIIDINTNGTQYGIYPYGAFTFYTMVPGDKNIEHNTINLRSASGSTFRGIYGIYGFNFGSSSIENNSISTEINSAGTLTGIYYQGGTATHNNVYLNNTNITNERYASINWNTGPTTAAAFLTEYPNSISTDPLFADIATGNYTPNSIPMANKGTAIASITTDFNGDSRSATTPDMGAIEYFIDVEVVSVDMVATSECAPYSESVVVTVKNNGMSPITNIPMKYSVNGGVAVRDIVIASVAAGATSQFTFATAPTLFGSANHVITVEVDGADDDPSNSSGTHTIATTASPYGGSLTQGALFDGYFNAGNMGNPDATVNTYVSEYAIVAPALATNYTYTLTATDNDMVDVTSSGFSLTNADTIVSMDPAVSLAGKTIFVEIEVLDNTTSCDTAFGRYIYVPHTPVASFDASDICLGDVAQFKNTSTLGGTSYIVTKWEFADPDASITNDNSDIKDGFWEYSTYGNNVSVEMTVANGLYPKFEYTATNTINVTPKPEIDFKVLNACEGVAITILNNTTLPTIDPITYAWDFGGEYNATGATPSYTFTTPGQRQISVTATANGCFASLTKNAYQFEKPVANFSSVGECNFVDVVFKNESTIPNGAGMGFAWDFNGEGISRAGAPKYAFATAGTKKVMLTATSEFGCTDSISKDIRLNPSPEANFTFDRACNLTPIQFTRTGTANVAQSTWAWDFNGESASGQENPSYLFNQVGTKEVTLTIADLNGCTNSITKELSVVLQAVADFEAGAVCEGDAAVFTNKSTVAAGNLSYSWSFGDGPTSISGDLSPTHIYGEPKTYNVTLEAIVDGGCSDQITKPVTVNPAPVAAYTFVKNGREVVFTGPAGNDKYRWTFGDGGKDEVAGPTYNYVNVDRATFEACLATQKGECWSEACETIVIDLLGVDQLTKNNSMINVYPNPSNGQFTVNVENAGDVVVKVGDILGNVISAKVVDNFNGTYSVDMSAVAEGVYFVQVRNGDFYATKRITVSK